MIRNDFIRVYMQVDFRERDEGGGGGGGKKHEEKKSSGKLCVCTEIASWTRVRGGVGNTQECQWGK